MTKNFLKKEIKWIGQKISSRKSYLFKQQQQQQQQKKKKKEAVY